jgi:transcriptional regulator with XRE-family HTH domain
VTIGDRLREERERLGFSQPALAGLAETTKKSQIDYEKGTTFPKANYLEVVAKVGVDVQYVITGVRSASLMGDEALLIEGFRQMDAETKKRTLAMVYGGTPPAPKFNVQGNVENQFENNYGGINIDKRGK